MKFFAFLFLVTTSIFYIYEIKLLLKISKHPFSKITGGLLVISLALIAFIFGIHSEIFSSHDKYNSDINNSYNWFNPEHIFKFPIEQYGINKSFIPITKIFEDSIVPSKNISRKITIVLDKTESTQSKEKYVEKINAKLKEYLKKNNPLQNDIDFEDLRTEDLFLLTALYEIKKSNIKTSIDLIFYKGDNSSVSPFENDITLNENNDFSSLFKKCYSVLSNINKEGKSKYSKTDFLYLLNKIGSNSFTPTNNTKDIQSSIIILSDFVHEESTGNSFESLNSQLQNLGEKINQVNLIKFKGNGTHSKWSNKTIELFRKNFNHLYYYEFDDALIETPELTDNAYPIQIAKMFSFSYDAKKCNPLTFFHSWNTENYKYDYKGRMYLKKKKKSKSKFNLGYGYSRNSIINSEYSYLLYNDKKLYTFQYTNNEIEKNDTISFSFITNQIESKDYFIELYKNNSSSIARIPIIFKPVLPITSSIYLVYLYLFFGISFSLLIIYYYWMLFKLNKKVRFKQNSKIILPISSFFSAIFLIIVFFKLIPHLLNFIKFGYNWLNIFVFTLIVFVFYSTLFNFSYKKKLKKHKLKETNNE